MDPTQAPSLHPRMETHSVSETLHALEHRTIKKYRNLVTLLQKSFSEWLWTEMWGSVFIVDRKSALGQQVHSGCAQTRHS